MHPTLRCSIDTADLTAGTPTLPELRQYRAVLVFSFAPFQDATVLGHVLADYVEEGSGGVVVCPFASAERYRALEVCALLMNGGFSISCAFKGERIAFVGP